jgi:hypothetical protein
MHLPDLARIRQLTSSYGPHTPPQLPLGFGDYLSLLWRLDRSAGHDGKTRYYRLCISALLVALGYQNRDPEWVLLTAAPGDLYATLGNAPYRQTERPPDAAHRRAAIQKLLALRSGVLSIGAHADGWVEDWPDDGIAAAPLRERVSAVLFAAFPSQFPVFARILLVIDIVLQELLIGTRKSEEFDLSLLVTHFGYPDPNEPDIHFLYTQEDLA